MAINYGDKKAELEELLKRLQIGAPG